MGEEGCGQEVTCLKCQDTGNYHSRQYKSIRIFEVHNIVITFYTAKNHQPVAMLLRTGLNNVVLPTLFKVVNNGEQHCYTPFSLNNIVQCC